MNGIYTAAASSKTTYAFKAPALFLALSSSLTGCTSDSSAVLMHQAWRGHASLETSATLRYSAIAKRPFVPKTDLGRSLAELRSRILKAGGARPAAVLLAEIKEQRGES